LIAQPVVRQRLYRAFVTRPAIDQHIAAAERRNWTVGIVEVTSRVASVRSRRPSPSNTAAAGRP
jgi:hypothetical protein